MRSIGLQPVLFNIYYRPALTLGFIILSVLAYIAEMQTLEGGILEQSRTFLKPIH